MSDPISTIPLIESQPMGSFDNEGEYKPREITSNDLGGLSLEDAYTATMVDIENGQMVEGTVVRIDKDEVLLCLLYTSPSPRD